MRIYIAGRLDAPDAAGYLRNVSQMIDAANTIRKRGHSVYVPALDLLLGIFDGKMEREDFLKLNMPWIEVCDALFMISMSQGVSQELRLAKKFGKKIYTRFSEIPNNGMNEEKTEIQEDPKLINFVEKGLKEIEEVEEKGAETERKKNQKLLIELEDRRWANTELAEATSYNVDSQIVALFFKHRKIARELEDKYCKKGH